MTDNLKLKEHDSKLVSLKESWERRDWCAIHNCTESELAAAVKAAGHSGKAVREYFEKHPPAKK